MSDQSSDLSRQIEEISKSLGGQFQSSKPDNIFVTVPPDDLQLIIRRLVDELGLSHLSTITGLDSGQSIDVLYHFWKGNVIASVKTSVPKSDAHAPSIVEIIPGAILYEMEVHDMFGVIFDGNPWMDRKLLLPDNYPDNLAPPLLKTTKSEEIRKAVGIEG